MSSIAIGTEYQLSQGFTDGLNAFVAQHQVEKSLVHSFGIGKTFGEDLFLLEQARVLDRNGGLGAKGF